MIFIVALIVTLYNQCFQPQNNCFMKTKLSNLRALFNSDNFDTYNIDGYIIPHSDEYQNEYTPDCSKRLEYITGFKGSNGIAIITKDNQYFWTDGRYQLQAKQELPDFTLCDRSFNVIASDKRNAVMLSSSSSLQSKSRGSHDNDTYKLLRSPGSSSGPEDDDVVAMRLGYNPMLFTSAQIEAFSKNLNLVPVTEDLVDKIWLDKPKAPNSAAYLYPIKYSGQDVLTKLEQVRKNFCSSNALITQPDSICWLLNIRGADIESVAVILGYLILSQDKATFFTDLSRISSEIRLALQNVEFKESKQIFDILKETKEFIMFDPASCPLGLQNLIANKVEGVNPCLIPKSCKNEVEIQCAKAGHIKDAIALCEGLTWVQNNRGITEYDIAGKLTELRAKQSGYVTNSFPTIAGFRENGAIIHYNATMKGSKTIEGDGILLIDSGAHYLGCTTDVTRVLVFGKPTEEQKRRYTQVLKGHIALSRVKFPVGTFGCNIDILARQYLWEEALDYAHGTGHGVGNMLSVHEAPTYIGQVKTKADLKEGMIVSNEPGFYKEGEFGIRIENLMYVKKSSVEGFLEFEMLTLVPYARNLIDIKMLTEQEVDYLKIYYDRIKNEILPFLSPEAKKWYEMECCIEF